MPHAVTRVHSFLKLGPFVAWLVCVSGTGWCATTNVYLKEVPDYAWYYGCMGTASGNLMGFWDRHGFPDFYTGQANGGVAPLNNSGTNIGVVTLWVSAAGQDGRPANLPGHFNDYYSGYESTAPDPYITAHRPEHTPDCICDFIGMDQLKWTNMAGECSGNIDGFCFVYWDTNGDRRVDYVPKTDAGDPVRDVQSGLRAWTQSRGYDCTVFTQLVDFNPTVPTQHGFTFDHLKAEIDTGYPVLLFLQNYYTNSRTVGPLTNVNPQIHSMLAYGYYIANGVSYVRYRTSWASGNNSLKAWNAQNWEANLPVRGVIGYHPLPKIRNATLQGSDLSVQWDGPAADLITSAGITRVHGYIVEVSPAVSPPDFLPASPLLLTNSYTITNCFVPAYVRVELVKCWNPAP